MDWLSTLRKVAPTVATAIAGPLGGMAVSAIGDLLGISDATQETIAEAFQAGKLTPDQITRLKELELKYQDNEKERGFKYAELAYKSDELVGKDRASAREMQVSTHSKMPAVITVLVTFGFFGVLASLLINPEFKANEVVLVMVGQLSAVWGACVGFYVSTTFSSANKTKLLTQAQPA